jgi:acyl transferase domain-containing protein
LEAHGTGTALGDPIEVGAAIGSFSEMTAIESSSLKGNMGHLESAASGGGIVSLFSTSLVTTLVAPNCQLRVFNPHLASLLKKSSFSMPVSDVILIQ